MRARFRIADGPARTCLVRVTTGCDRKPRQVVATICLSAGQRFDARRAGLLVSPEFGEFLFSNGLSTANLTGADVGDALVSANAVPEPSALAILSIGSIALLAIRRCGA